MSELRFDGKVAVVTGAGNGLGRSHALLFASRGAKVVVNDLGGAHTGGGKSSEAADRVVAEIKEAGGEAVANYDSVVDGDKIIQTALDTWGRVDIVVNNAGILRDVSYHKMSDSDWDLIYQVHVLGAHKVTHAAWNLMREQGYGRIVNTASAAGIYGNFGQVNYAMAKLGIVGFTNSLAIEGGKKNVHANVIAPIAGSRMTETVLPKDVCDALKPEYVSPLVLWLCHESCEENGGLFEVGGGFYGKLRWERAAGKTWKLGREISPENIRDQWGAITGFDETEHPATVMESMGPIMANVNAGESKGGNEFIDVDEALGFEFPERKTKYEERDLALYGLGIGAATDPLDEKELRYVYEMHQDFQPFPTYAVIPALKLVMDMAREGIQPPGQNYGLDRILHGEQYTELKRPLPSNAKLTHNAKITDVWDKGKNALIVTEVQTKDEDGDLLAINRITTLVRGAGGWGGDRGPTEETNVPPERAPDKVVEQKIDENQALLYRLSGDWNPLHADPGMAKAFGFEKPILHGLCTYGYAARHVINSFCDGDPRYFKSISVRFADSVYPGETLVTEMWKEDGKIVFRCKVKERDSEVVTRAAIELYKEIPKKAPKPKAAAASAAPVSAEPISADVFNGIKGYFAANADGVKKIGKVFQFQLSNPDSVWTLDCPNAAVGAGETTKPDCTLAMKDADFMDMVTGKADAMKLFSSGALKISGDLMASQRLDFLQKMDPKFVMDAAKARAGGGGGEAAAASDAPAGTDPVEDVFLGIQSYVEGNNALTSIGKTFLFKLSEPDSSWTIDCKEGRVSYGGDSADCTLALTTEDFLSMTRGEADPMKLFSTGKLKISGDLMASQKLDFLQKIDPKEAAEAVAKARAEGRSLKSATSAAPAASKQVNASRVFEGLEARIKANPSLASEVGAVLQFNVTDPDSSWTVDLTGPGSVSKGKAENAATTLTLSDEALGQLVETGNAKDLFMRGSLKVDGDIANAHKLGFLKGA